MMVPWAALNCCHPNTAQFARGVKWKRHRLVAEEMREITEWYFWLYVRPPILVPLFKYLGQIITASDNDWPTVAINLWRERKKWDRMMRTLGR